MAVSFLSEQGRFLARVQGPVSGNVLLRREQYRRADDMDISARMARWVLTGKLANSRIVLKRGLRDHGEKLNCAEIQESVKRLGNSLENLQSGLPLNSLRGIEGEAARAYFSVFDHLIVASGGRFCVQRKKPPSTS